MVKRIFLAFMLVALPSGYASADLIADAGGGLGVGITVPSGTFVTVSLNYVPITAAFPFDGVGLDLNWTPTGSGLAMLAGPSPGFLLAGLATGAAGVDDLLAPGGAGSVVPGLPLFNPTVGPVGAFNIGGGSHFDVGGAALTLGMSYGVPSGSAMLDLMGADFIVSGMPGDTITFTPSGILPPLTTPIPPGAWAPMTAGAHYYSNLTPGAGLGLVTVVDVVTPVTITIGPAVPEPTALILLFPGSVVLCLRRRR